MFGRALANTVLLPPIITARRAFRECRFLRIIIPNNFFFFFPRGRTPIQRHLIRFGKNVPFSNVGIIYYKNKHFATKYFPLCQVGKSDATAAQTESSCCHQFLPESRTRRAWHVKKGKKSQTLSSRVKKLSCFLPMPLFPCQKMSVYLILRIAIRVSWLVIVVLWTFSYIWVNLWWDFLT